MEAGIQSDTTTQLIGVSTSCTGGHNSDGSVGVRFRFAAPYTYAWTTNSVSGPKNGGWSSESTAPAASVNLRHNITILPLLYTTKMVLCPFSLRCIMPVCQTLIVYLWWMTTTRPGVKPKRWAPRVSFENPLTARR